MKGLYVQRCEFSFVTNAISSFILPFYDTFFSFSIFEKYTIARISRAGSDSFARDYRYHCSSAQIWYLNCLW